MSINLADIDFAALAKAFNDHPVVVNVDEIFKQFGIEESNQLAVAEALIDLHILNQTMWLAAWIANKKSSNMLFGSIQIRPTQPVELIEITFEIDNNMLSTARTMDAVDKIGKTVGYEP